MILVSCILFSTLLLHLLPVMCCIFRAAEKFTRAVMYTTSAPQKSKLRIDHNGYCFPHFVRGKAGIALYNTP
jgi:hypothetical protein